MFETGKSILQHLSNIGFRHRVGGRHHDGNHPFTEVRVGHADDRRLHHRLHLVDQLLDLFGVDVVTAGNNHVLGAANDRYPPLCIHDAKIPGDEIPVVAKFLGGLVRHLPVALKNVGTAYLYRAHLTVGECCAIIVGNAHFDARQGESNATGDPFTEQRIGGVDDGFAHAVALENAVPGTRLPRGKGLFGQRRRTADEHAHALAHRRVEMRLVQQPRIERRHAHHDRGLGKVTEHLLRFEARQEDRRRSTQQRTVQRNEQAVHVEHG